jgi:hypothetical protein
MMGTDPYARLLPPERFLPAAGAFLSPNVGLNVLLIVVRPLPRPPLDRRRAIGSSSRGRVGCAGPLRSDTSEGDDTLPRPAPEWPRVLASEKYDDAPDPIRASGYERVLLADLRDLPEGALSPPILGLADMTFEDLEPMRFSLYRARTAGLGYHHGGREVMGAMG